MRYFVWGLLIIVLSACGQSRYAKEGKSTLEAEQDYLTCIDSVLAEHEGLENASSSEKERLRDKCMEDKGYKAKR